MYLDSPVFVSTKVLRLLCLKMKVDELLLNLDNNRVSVDYCRVRHSRPQFVIAEISLWLYQQNI